MKLRTSCFNKAIFRKDLTRFAPVGALYTLCLLAGLMLMAGDKSAYPYYLANNISVSTSYMAGVNLCYGAVMAALLFGDLYNGRMCNGLHAMPLRRQELFVTHLAAGLLYSLVPTAIMALISLPLLGKTIVVGAWKMGLYWWLGCNLQFVCCFGIAVFAALCAGNWVGLGVVYAAIHFGSLLVHSLVENFYVPLLRGVVASDNLAHALCPLYALTGEFFDLDTMEYLNRLFYGRESEMTAAYRLVDATWQRLGIWAAVGVVFLGIAWLLYRGRDLESAGDPIAVKALVPVAQVLGAVALGSGAGMVFLSMLAGGNRVLGYIVLFGAVAVGWFAVRMVLARTSRVFQKKAILGLLPVLGVLGLSLLLTYGDVFGIASWVPDASQIKSVSMGNAYRSFTDEESIRAVQRLHELAIRSEDIPWSGRYDKSYLAQGLSLEEVYNLTSTTEYTDEQRYLEDTFRKAGNLYIEYDLGHGRTVQRRYIIWKDGENAAIYKQLRPSWEDYWKAMQYGFYIDRFPLELEQLSSIYISGYSARRVDISQEDVQSLVAAVKADFDEGHMGNSFIQEGIFRTLWTDEYTGEEGYVYETSLYLDVEGRIHDQWMVGLNIDVTPTATHTLNWLRERGYLTYEVLFPE